jgi:hypothetical protein
MLKIDSNRWYTRDLVILHTRILSVIELGDRKKLTTNATYNKITRPIATPETRFRTWTKKNREIYASP